jgi:D-erythrulose 1-phosphate 3-epimerase
MYFGRRRKEVKMNAPNGYHLGINTGFAVNRYSEPEEWIRIVGEELELKVVQLTADMLNVDLPAKVISNQVNRIHKKCEEYDIKISSTFTGAFTRVNHLAHPDEEIRKHWVKWFKKFVDISVDLGSDSMGSHFGIFTHKDNNNPINREERRRQNIDNWHEIGLYAKEKGLKFISWEPMSISREQGEIIREARKLQEDVNTNSPLPFKICLDVDHGDLSSKDPRDTDPYAWLKEFAVDAPLIHLKQSSVNKSGHWPFTAEHNAVGRIQPERVIKTLMDKSVENVDLILELSFREREPSDSSVIDVLKESVNFWRSSIKN